MEFLWRYQENPLLQLEYGKRRSKENPDIDKQYQKEVLRKNM